MSDDKIRVREDQEKCSSCKMRKFDPPKGKCQDVDFHWLMDGKKWEWHDEAYRQVDTTSTRRTAFDGLLAPTDDEESSSDRAFIEDKIIAVKQTSGENVPFMIDDINTDKIVDSLMSSGEARLPSNDSKLLQEAVAKTVRRLSDEGGTVGGITLPAGGSIKWISSTHATVTKVNPEGTYTVTITT